MCWKVVLGLVEAMNVGGVVVSAITAFLLFLLRHVFGLAAHHNSSVGFCVWAQTD
jgi:hypothetical protein